MAYWLLKSEPTTFSLNDLKKAARQTEAWTGVRNYQARNFIRDKMKVGDLGFFYHSSCKVPGIVGMIEITHAAYPDPCAFDPQSPYYDPKSTAQNPRWFCVDVKFVKEFSTILSLTLLKNTTALHDFALIRPGNRLSVLPVKDKEWSAILKLEPK